MELLRFVDDTIFNTKMDSAGDESERAYFECKLLLELIWTPSSHMHTHSIRHPSHCLPVQSPSGHGDSTTHLWVRPAIIVIVGLGYLLLQQSPPVGYACYVTSSNPIAFLFSNVGPILIESR